MTKVIFIGVGKLGVRHLEALLISQIQSSVWVVDTDNESISIAKQLTKNRNHSNTLVFCNIIPEIGNFDLAIIATNSKNRFEIAQELLTKNSVKHLVLEKIVFTVSSEYVRFKKLIDESKTTCFVNLPRRLFLHYKFIREITWNCNSFDARISGSSWGLLSNSLHFIDLIHFLFSEECSFIDLSQLTDFFPSKRKGYMEANGKIQLYFANKGRALIECTEGDFNGISILLKFDGKEIEIHEKLEGSMKFSLESNPRKIQSLMVKNTTSLIFKNLVEENNCDIPTYDEIYKEHLLFIQELEKKFQQDYAQYQNQILVT
ncbi:MAG: Gfo/Idh/MocA family oxidoreductase [Bacteroidota bacterium]